MCDLARHVSRSKSNHLINVRRNCTEICIFILVINQLCAQNFCSAISLFHACTCFVHHVLIIWRSKLYYIATGIVTHIGGRPVRRLGEDGVATYRCDDTRGCVMQF